MPHSCTSHWGAAAQMLSDLLDEEDSRQTTPTGGWAYLMSTDGDLQPLVSLYYEICLALGQPADPPGHWADPMFPERRSGMAELGMTLVPAEASTAISLAASNVQTLMRADGTQLGPGGNFFHPQYGMPEWLKMGAWNPASVTAMENLLSRIQNALDR